MVVAYLEKIREQFINEKRKIQAQLNEAMLVRKEHIELIKVLVTDDGSSFEAFTPKSVNSFHKKKIEKLKAEQKVIELDMDVLEKNLENIENKIIEINAVIKNAKRRLGE